MPMVTWADDRTRPSRPLPAAGCDPSNSTSSLRSRPESSWRSSADSAASTRSSLATWARTTLEQLAGRMINIYSVYSTRPSKLAPVYSMAKAAVNSMTQTVAAELGERGITVSAIAPGWTVTDANAEARRDPALVAQVGRDTVLGRMAEPADIAGGWCHCSPRRMLPWLIGQYVDANGRFRVS
jgi:NAD(P)-dependent dehydrogenase (short-subunit alcohol dehydrogenase family)